MSGSLSLAVIILSIMFVLPIAIWKTGHDSQFPLVAHDFSFPTELLRFYLPYASVLTLLCGIFAIAGYGPNWAFFDRVFSLQAASSSPISLESVLNIPTITFLVLVYVVAIGGGFFSGWKHRNKVIEAVSSGTDFFAVSHVKMVGLWGALVNQRKNLVVHLDVLATGDLLYSGTLFYYEAEKSEIKVLALKNTKRFLVPLSDVKGNDELKYQIPGDVTYFAGSQIKNINIRQIEEEQDDILILAENLVLNEEMIRAIEAGLKNTEPGLNKQAPKPKE